MLGILEMYGHIGKLDRPGLGPRSRRTEPQGCRGVSLGAGARVRPQGPGARTAWRTLGRPGGSLGRSGAVWGCLGLPGPPGAPWAAWVCSGLSGAALGCLGLLGAAWGYLGLPGTRTAWGPGAFGCFSAAWTASSPGHGVGARARNRRTAAWGGVARDLARVRFPARWPGARGRGSGAIPSYRGLGGWPGPWLRSGVGPGALGPGVGAWKRYRRTASQRGPGGCGGGGCLGPGGRERGAGHRGRGLGRLRR